MHADSFAPAAEGITVLWSRYTRISPAAVLLLSFGGSAVPRIAQPEHAPLIVPVRRQVQETRQAVAARQNAVDGGLYELRIEEGERQMFASPACRLPVTCCDRLNPCLRNGQ